MTRTVSQLLWERDSDEQWRNHQKLFKALLRETSAKDFCGELFEPAFHALCVRGATLTIYPMDYRDGRVKFAFKSSKCESGSNSLELELGPRDRFFFGDEDNPITSLCSNYYYQPIAKNYPSFVYDPNSRQISAFQVTVAGQHGLASKGIRAVRELGRQLQIDDLKIRIIVVVFRNFEADFEIKKELYDSWGLQVYVVQVTEDQLYPHS